MLVIGPGVTGTLAVALAPEPALPRASVEEVAVATPTVTLLLKASGASGVIASTSPPIRANGEVPREVVLPTAKVPLLSVTVPVVTPGLELGSDTVPAPPMVKPPVVVMGVVIVK